MEFDLATELDLIGRLLVAAVLGAVIGIERELHDHPAGVRTHLLVALGSALFTVLSIVGFPSADGTATDPSRVAAQIVTGIGFLGAGAIIKYGPSVRGLTTAASLWAAAAIGMAAGAGLPFLGIATTVIVFLSLWPLRLISGRLENAGHAGSMSGSCSLTRPAWPISSTGFPGDMSTSSTSTASGALTAARRSTSSCAFLRGSIGLA